MLVSMPSGKKMIRVCAFRGKGERLESVPLGKKKKKFAGLYCLSGQEEEEDCRSVPFGARRRR